MASTQVGCPVCSKRFGAAEIERHVNSCLLNPPPPTAAPAKHPAVAPLPPVAAVVDFGNIEEKKRIERARLDRAAEDEKKRADEADRKRRADLEHKRAAEDAQRLELENKRKEELARKRKVEDDARQIARDDHQNKLLRNLLSDIQKAVVASGADDRKFDDTMPSERLRTRLSEMVDLLRAEEMDDRDRLLRDMRSRHDDELNRLRIEDMKLTEEERTKKADELSRIRIEEMQRSEAAVRELRKLRDKQADEFSVERIKQDEKQVVEMKKLKDEQDRMRVNLTGKMLPGEAEARKTGEIKTIKLVPKRTSEFGDIGEYHFRYAESQFLRLPGAQGYHVESVDYVINPPLMNNFEETQQVFAKRGVPAQPVLAFHQSHEDDEFLMQANFQQAHPLDGIVFSETTCPRALATVAPVYGGAAHYGKKEKWRRGAAATHVSSSSPCILLSKILVGRPYRVSGESCMGVRARDGYESVLNHSGTQLAVFDNKQILPCYLVNYAPGPAAVRT